MLFMKYSKKIIFLIFLFSFKIYAGSTNLKLEKSLLTSTSINSLRFIAKASNGKVYKAAISCFKVNNTSNNYTEGSIRVLRDEYQVGADVSFAYKECLDLRAAILEDEEELLLTWDQEAFEAFISAKLEFKRSQKN